MSTPFAPTLCIIVMITVRCIVAKKQLFPLQSAYIPGQIQVNFMQAKRLNSIDVFNTGVIRECFVNLKIPRILTPTVISQLSFAWKQIESFIKVFVLKVRT